MCGIAGIVDFETGPIAESDLTAMCRAITRRGPDEEAFHFGDGVALGLRRLSIIGLEPGRQPVHSETGDVITVMNGEIYNYRLLRRRLEALGHRFDTDTDTETIVHLYEEIGPDCVNELRGMFAFALWDKRSSRLLLARDRLGIKPLYYARIGQRFVFASELKALLALPYLPRELDWRSLDHLFACMTTPASESLIAGVHKLEPGCILTLQRDGAPRTERYWRIRFDPNRMRRESETVEELRHLLDESVEMHMVSDVPVGAFLSGGLDSSSVVALMARHSSGPLHTFSVGFSDARYDESRQARWLADTLGTRHEELILEPDIGEFLEDFAWNMDEPFGDSSAIPTYMVSRLAARRLKVVLSGDGGDELFAGYDRYRVEARERTREIRIPPPLGRLFGMIGAAMPEGMKGRNYLRHAALRGERRYFDSATLFGADSRTRLFRPEIGALVERAGPSLVASVFPGSPGMHWLSRLQQLDLEGYLPLDILTKVDRMSMANSLEVRVPLLDHKLVEFAATVPPELLLNRGESKYILRRAMRGTVPDAIFDRPKRGFAVPLAAWFRKQLAGTFRALLLSSESCSRDFLDSEYVAKIFSMHMRGRPLDSQLWTLISFELWCRRFLGPSAYRPMPRSDSAGARPLAVRASL